MKQMLDGLLGLAIGDALGVPVEFKSRKQLALQPVADMMGYGSHPVPEGCWSDDTTMTICLMQSLIDHGYFNLEATMDNFVKWVEEGAFTATDELFDIGGTCRKAILNYSIFHLEPVECGPKSIQSNGNGSLMRILPVAYYAYQKNLNNHDLYQLVKDVSSLTHGHEVSILGCYIYVKYVIGLLDGKRKEEAYYDVITQDYRFFTQESLSKYAGILNHDISLRKVETIKSSGYVVDSLEASLWCFLNTNNYEEATLQAVNLGEDTDTVGAITGSLAGIYYGYESIRSNWLHQLLKLDDLMKMAKQFDEVIHSKK